MFNEIDLLVSVLGPEVDVQHIMLMFNLADLMLAVVFLRE